METMRTIVLVTCAVSLLSGVLDALKPNKKFDRQMRLLLSVVFLLAFLAPFVKGLDDLHWNSWETDAVISDHLTAEMAQQTLQYAQENLEQTLVQYLQEHNLADAQVQVQMHMTDDDSIEINRVIVSCTNSETATALLKECLGEEVTIDVENIS